MEVFFLCLFKFLILYCTLRVIENIFSFLVNESQLWEETVLLEFVYESDPVFRFRKFSIPVS